MILKLFYFTSMVLYFLSLSWKNSLGFWLTIEVASLILMCGFFKYGIITNRYLGLLYYLFMSGLSSFFLFSGLIIKFLKNFILLSFALKMGVFPFFGWMLVVYKNLSWFLLFIISMVSKVSILYLPLIKLKDSKKFMLMTSFIVSFMYLSFLFWLKCSKMKYYLGISSISSGIVLFYLCLNDKIYYSEMIYLMYVFTKLFLFLIFYNLDKSSILANQSIMYFFLLIAMPCSLMLFYKFLSVISLLKVNMIFILFWMFYSISEQIFLVIFLLEKFNFSNSF